MTDIIKSRTDVRIPITLTIYNNMIFIHIEGMKSRRTSLKLKQPSASRRTRWMTSLCP